MYTMADYETKASNVYVSVSGHPAERFWVKGSLVYNKSTAEYGRVEMPDIEDRLNGALENQDFTFDELPTYSNLDYSFVQGSLGFSYLLSEGVTFTVDGLYADLTDDAVWVYGDESGSLFQIRSGFKVDF
jgi:hypothetical protein